MLGKTRLFGLVVVLLVAGRAAADERFSSLREPSVTRTVGTPRDGERVPLVVVLPALGGTAEEMLARLAPAIPLPAYVALLPGGRPSSTDALTDFAGYLTALEARLRTDVERAKRELPVDADRIYLLGFSLGGDAAWALLGRLPDLVRGALVASSRASATLRAAALTTLRTRKARVAFTVGQRDDAGRVRGIEAARDTLERAQIPTDLFAFDGAHQLPPPDDDTLPRALRFLFER